MRSDPHTQNHSGRGESAPGPPAIEGAGAEVARNLTTEERERLLDEVLEGTFPASDPPSWTMGAAVVSRPRH